MVVLHAEPILTLSLGREDVVRRIQIHLTVEYTRRWVGSVLISDNRVLCHSSNCCQAQP